MITEPEYNNEIEVNGDTSIITIRSRKHGTFNIIIDTDDIEIVDYYKWVVSEHKGGTYYIVARDKGCCRNIQLHRLITDCPKGLTVDHINRNPLDNRKCNLKVCTQAENNLNKPLSSKNKTGYKNISVCKRTEKYRVTFSRNKKWKQIGTYKNIEDAIEARDEYLERISNGRF